MVIKVNNAADDDAKMLPAILDVLPDGFSAWMSGGNALIYEGDVEVASVPVKGLDTQDAVAEVEKALKGVI